MSSVQHIDALAPYSIHLIVAGFNPNDGRGGTTRTISTLTRFDWRLLIDDQPASSAEESGLTEVITDRPSSRRASSPMLASEISGEPEAKVKQHKLSADAGGGYSLSVPKGQHKLSALQPFWRSRPRRS